MHLERILIVVEQRTRPDGSYSDFDLRSMEAPLRHAGLVDNIDIFYYRDYLPSCDEALINYCLEKKPQAVLLSLQNIALRKEGAPTPDGVAKITHQLGIPTVAFWFDIYNEDIAQVLERCLHAITLNILLGVDTSTHKTMQLENTNYVYAGGTFDERQFDKPEGVRDIPVGFLGFLHQNRRRWIEGLAKFGISPYLAGGPANWMSYEEYLGLMSRLKIALNLSFVFARDCYPTILADRGQVWEALYWLTKRLKTYGPALAKNPLRVRRIIPVLKNTVSELSLKPKYVIKGRVWEALWCRTFLLEEDNPVTSLYFEPYVDYVPFTTLKDLVDKIRYYLEHEEERDRIRMNGRATIEKYYNSRIYWENVFEVIGLQSDRQYQHHPGEIWNKAYFDKWYLSHPSVLNQINPKTKDL